MYMFLYFLTICIQKIQAKKAQDEQKKRVREAKQAYKSWMQTRRHGKYKSLVIINIYTFLKYIIVFVKVSLIYWICLYTYYYQFRRTKQCFRCHPEERSLRLVHRGIKKVTLIDTMRKWRKDSNTCILCYLFCFDLFAYI